VEPTKNNLRSIIFKEIDDERQRQNKKFGDQSGNTFSQWITILTEEVGESAEEALNIEFGKTETEKINAMSRLETEMNQVAAVAVAIIEMLSNKRTCPYRGCSNPFASKPPCPLCYE